MKFGSIRHRVTFEMILYIAALLLLIACSTYFYFRNTLRDLIFRQQYTLVSSIAEELDNKLQLSLKTMVAASTAAGEDIVQNSDANRLWLSGRPATKQIFNNGLYILDAAGNIVASSISELNKNGLFYSDRDFFKECKTLLKPCISKPYLSMWKQRPVIMMSVPVFDKSGRLQGFLCGEINLQDKDGLFGNLSHVRFGISGYLYVIAPDRTMVMHPDILRVMKKNPKPGENPMLDSALEGFEGSGEAVNSRGERIVVSFRKLSSTGWILAANYPIGEVMRPITRFRNFYLAGMFIMLLIGIAVAWRLGTRITSPVVNLTGEIRDLAGQDLELSGLMEHEYPDEIGILADTFNSLLQKLYLREQALKESEERFRQLAEVFPETIFETDMNGIITYTNRYGIEQYGYDSDDYSAGLSVYDVVVPADREKVRKQAHDSFKGVNTGYVDYKAKRKDGTTFDAMGLSVPVIINGKPAGIRGFVLDITQRKQAEEDLRQSEEKFYKAFQTSLNAIVIISLDNGEFIEVNDAFVSMTGFTRQELLEISSWGGNLWVDKREGQEVFSILTRGRAVIGRECRFWDRKGGVLTVLLSAQTIQLRSMPCILASISDITERKRMEEKIVHLATHDQLTDLPSLRLAKERLELALSLASRNNSSVAVMFIDLDGFKKINDSLGHDAGDYVLKLTAMRLLSCIRESDTVARIGGDEFLLIATGIHSHENVSQIAGKVISLISEPMTFNENQASVSASIGIALYPEDGDGMDELIKKADGAMYLVKNSGKNGFRFVGTAVN